MTNHNNNQCNIILEIFIVLVKFYWLTALKSSVQKKTINDKMAVYCWGSTAHGELGLGGVEHEQVNNTCLEIFFQKI